jgi:hypothetical protein
MESALPPVVFSSALRSESNFVKPKFLGIEQPDLLPVREIWNFSGRQIDPDDALLDDILQRLTTGDTRSISFLGNVGIGTTQPAYRLDVQNGSARFSSTRIMPVSSTSTTPRLNYTLTLTYPAKRTMIYGEFRGFVGEATAAGSACRISFKIVQNPSSQSALGDVSLLGSTVTSVSMTSSSPTSTKIQVTSGSPIAWSSSGDLLLVESENAVSTASWSADA